MEFNEMRESNEAHNIETEACNAGMERVKDHLSAYGLHPESIIVLLHVMRDGKERAGASGYNLPDTEALLVELLTHIRGVAAAAGKEVMIMPLGERHQG